MKSALKVSRENRASRAFRGSLVPRAPRVKPGLRAPKATAAIRAFPDPRDPKASKVKPGLKAQGGKQDLKAQEGKSDLVDFRDTRVIRGVLGKTKPTMQIM